MLNRKKDIEITNLIDFDMTYSSSTIVNGYTRYKITYDKKYYALLKPFGEPEEKAIKKEISKDKVKELEDILIKYNVEKWNGFNKSNQYVLDGNSFHMSIRLENGDYISASGYMEWPKDFQLVNKEIDDYFKNI